MTAKPLIALAMGDPAGISPELTAKVVALDDVRDAARLVVVGDRRKFIDRIAGILVKGLVDRKTVAGDQQGISVRRRRRDRARRDVGGRTGPVLDHDLEAELVGEALSDDSRNRIDPATWSKSDHESDLPVRIVGDLCPGPIGHKGGEHESAYGHERD